MTTDSAILALHEDYVRLTGFPLRLDYSRESAWAQWIAAGFTREDLAGLVAWLRVEIKRGNRNSGSLRFSNLIGQLDRTEEDIAVMRARRRAQPPAEVARRQHALRDLRPDEPAPAGATPVPIAEVLRQMRAAATGRNDTPHDTTSH